jgi:hypothetical protein
MELSGHRVSGWAFGRLEVMGRSLSRLDELIEGASFLVRFDSGLYLKQD